MTIPAMALQKVPDLSLPPTIDDMIHAVRATYGTGPWEECVACGRLTARWSHGVTSYPLCPVCMTVAQEEAR